MEPLGPRLGTMISTRPLTSSLLPAQTDLITNFKNPHYNHGSYHRIINAGFPFLEQNKLHPTDHASSNPAKPGEGVQSQNGFAPIPTSAPGGRGRYIP